MKAASLRPGGGGRHHSLDRGQRPDWPGEPRYRGEEAAGVGVLARRGQVKSGGRSDKIRTYNYKENRVTDHRIGLTLHSLDQVLAGQLDDLTDALAADERSRQLADDEQ